MEVEAVVAVVAAVVVAVAAARLTWIFSSSSAASSVDFCCSSSGCSCWIVMPSSWPSSPERVTVKLTSQMSAAASGGRSGLGLRVTSSMRKFSLKSSCLSPSATILRGPAFCRSLRASG